MYVEYVVRQKAKWASFGQHTFGQIRSSRKTHTHPMEGRWKFQGGGGGVLKAKFLEAMYENKLEFPAVRVMQNKKPSVGGVWIFSGTAQVMEMHPVS